MSRHTELDGPVMATSLVVDEAGSKTADTFARRPTIISLGLTVGLLRSCYSLSALSSCGSVLLMPINDFTIVTYCTLFTRLPSNHHSNQSRRHMAPTLHHTWLLLSFWAAYIRPSLRHERLRRRDMLMFASSRTYYSFKSGPIDQEHKENRPVVPGDRSGRLNRQRVPSGTLIVHSRRVAGR
jgi:hypothetical protein